MLKRLIVVLLVALSLSGCVSAMVSMTTTSAGTKIDRTHIKDIKVGAQDKAQILAWFGEPYTQVELKSNPYGCVERVTFEYARAKRGKAFYSEILVVDFDKNGKVCDYAFNEKGVDN